MSDLDEFLTDDIPDLDDEQDRAGWAIDGDQRATSALRRISREQRELDRIRQTAQAEIDRIQMWASQASSVVENRIQFLTDSVTDYYRQLERSNPKLAQTYKLPTGSIKKAKQPDRVVVTDEDAFVEWAKKWRPEALTIKPKVSEVKGKGFDRETSEANPVVPVVDRETGDTVPGVQAERGQVKYSVSVGDADPYDGVGF